MKKYLNLLRVRQWTKNLIIFSGLIFSEKVRNRELLRTVIWAVVSFSLVSSFIYIINDIKDLKKDRLNPEKTGRAIASGQVTPFVAVLIGIMLLAFSFYTASLSAAVIFIYLLIYLVLSLLYIFIFRNIFLLDVIFISSGFVLRAMAGASVINVTISPWLITCSFLLSLLISLGKRRYEIELMSFMAGDFRGSLKLYSRELLEGYMLVISSVTVMAYSIYTFSAPNLPQNHSMMLTIPFVIYGIFRYYYILKTRRIGGSPEDILLKDTPILINLILWIASCILILAYF